MPAVAWAESGWHGWLGPAMLLSPGRPGRGLGGRCGGSRAGVITGGPVSIRLLPYLSSLVVPGYPRDGD